MLRQQATRTLDGALQNSSAVASNFTSDGHRIMLDYDYRDQRQVIDNYGQPFNVKRELTPVDRDARYYSPFNAAKQRIDRFTLADEYDAASFLTLLDALVYEQRDLVFTRKAGGNPLDTEGVMTGHNGRMQSDNSRCWTGQLEAVFTGNVDALASTTLLGTEWQRIDLGTVRRNYALANATTVDGTGVVPETAIPTVTTPGFDREIDFETLSVYGQHEVSLRIVSWHASAAAMTASGLSMAGSSAPPDPG